MNHDTNHRIDFVEPEWLARDDWELGDWESNRSVLAAQDRPWARHVLAVMAHAEAVNRSKYEDPRLFAEIGNGWADVLVRWRCDDWDEHLTGIGLAISRGRITHLLTIHYEFHPTACASMEAEGWVMIEERLEADEWDEPRCTCGRNGCDSRWYDAERTTYRWRSKPVATLRALVGDGS